MLKMKDKFRNLGPSGILYRFHPGGISLGFHRRGKGIINYETFEELPCPV